MRKKLDYEDLKFISGGFIKKLPDKSFMVYGTTKDGHIEEVFSNFLSALRYDWELFNRKYRLRDIHTIGDLAEYYGYGDCCQ